jgi:hypothetical protein
MPNEALRKFHHFIPVLHLRHFADESGLLWVHDKLAGRSFKQRPERVGGELFLYAPEDGANPKDDVLEKWFAEQIDGPAADPVSRLALSDGLPQFTNQERSAVAAYMAGLDVLTPRLRDDILEYYRTGLATNWEALHKDPTQLRADILEATGVEYSDEDLARFAAQFEIVVPKSAWLGFISRHLNRAAARLHHATWTLFRAPVGYDFVASDAGILKCRGSYDKIVDNSPGWSGGGHWLIPLSPSRALAIAPDNRYASVEPTREWMLAARAQLVKDAQRFVYSRGQLEVAV